MFSISHSGLVRFLLFFYLVVACFAGYFEDYYGEEDKTIRVLIVFLVFFVSFVGALLSLQKYRYVHPVALGMLLCILYSFLVAVFRGEALVAISSLLRLLSVVFIVFVISNYCFSFEMKAASLLAFFFKAAGFFIVVQTIFDFYVGRFVFLNGGDRYFGSVGSPIGFAASSLVVLIGLLYFWLCFRFKVYFYIGLAVVWTILMTGTRSISVFALLIVWFSMALYFAKWKKWLFMALTPLLAVSVLVLLADSPLATRLENTYASGSMDNSTAFRMYILDVFFSKSSIVDIFFGLGLGGFHAWFFDNTGVPEVAPHFEFLWLLSEFGVVGVFLYILSGAYLAFVFLMRLKSNSRPLVFLFFSVFFLHQIFLQLANPFYFYQFYLPFALLLGVLLASLNLRCRLVSRG
jgi:hypothetical protein